MENTIAEIVESMAFYAPVFLAVVTGIVVFGWLRRRGGELEGTLWLRVVSACASGLAMVVIGALIAVPTILWMQARSVWDETETATAIGILALQVDVAISVVIAALVGTGVGRSTRVRRQS